MPIRVLRNTDVRFFVSCLCATCLLLGTTASWAAVTKKGKSGAALSSAAAKGKTSGTAATITAQPPKDAAPAAASTAPKEWGPYLDVAYELTYWEKAEIREWREKRDQEIGETLAAYIAAWSGKLNPLQESTPADRKAEQLPVYRDREFLRLAIAQTIDYLQSDNLESLGSAAKTIERLKGKSSMPEIAYWTGLVLSLQALESSNSDEFITQVYDIWNRAVLYIEQNELARDASSKTAASSTPFYYRNLINLVVNRAIISRKQENLNALGPLFVMMKDRNLGEKDSEGKYTTTLVQRIVDGLTAPDTDRYRLNFTVALIESKRLQQVASAKLDAEGMTDAVQKTFEQARTYNDLVFKWAASRRSSGVVTAAVDYLDLTSFAIQRLPDNEKAPAYQFFSALPGQEGGSAILKSMAIFNDIATYSAGGWERAGYQSRELYLKSSHRLWRAIMELALWTGDFYLAKLNAAKDVPSMKRDAVSMQAALDSYLDFLTAQRGRGLNDVVPDSAYFGAFEAADKLAYAYQKVSAFGSDNSAYNLWFTHRLLATELFPLSLREVRQTLAALKQDGRYNLYLDYFIPLASRVKQSPAISNWITGQQSETVSVIPEYTSAIEKLFAGESDSDAKGTAAGTPSAATFVASFQTLREEMQRKPDHPVHRLLKSFYFEEFLKNTSFTQLLKDPSRLDRAF
ncbi:MAG: hypothetical protein H6Q56_1224 [Deltaproteobacteria bacterium]|nr:hypothetical protein [Deltaproteobacteria bacterium]